MASVFKRKRKKNGQQIEAEKYTIQYTDADGNVCRVTGYTDKAKSWELARKLESGEAVDEHIKHRKTPLTDHLEAYKRHLKAQNNSADYVAQTEKRIKAILDGCGFVQLRNVNVPDLENWLADQREKKFFGIKTSNYYARDFKSFITWLVDSNRAETNRLARFAPLNSETDDRRERRFLDADEFAKLIEATVTGPLYRRINGVDRVMLYLVAANTGLRVGELASLTPESFDLDAGVVNVRAAHSKRRRNDEQPLRRGLIELLRQWLMGRSGKLWPSSWSNTAAQMLQLDLKAAGIPYEDTAGRVFDFHALRHQFITGLALADVPVKVAQILARHSTIVLTMDCYSHVGKNDAAEALEKLPPLPALDLTLLTQNLTQTPVPACQNVSLGGTTQEVALIADSDGKSLPCHELTLAGTACRCKEKRGAGRSRTDDGGFAIRCLSHLATAP